MGAEEERNSKEESVSGTEELKSKIADQLEAEMDSRDETHLESERAALENLNQGMSTGTHDSTRLGVNWGPSYTTGPKAKAATANPGSEDKKDDSDSKA